MISRREAIQASTPIVLVLMLALIILVVVANILARVPRALELKARESLSGPARFRGDTLPTLGGTALERP